MYQSLDIFHTASAMAQHAGKRQALVASNIANADTPGYAAKEIASFQDTFLASSNMNVRQSRLGHIQLSTINSTTKIIDASNEAAPNGNNVSLEDELLNSVAVGREHNRALAIYKHAMDVLRTSIGR